MRASSTPSAVSIVASPPAYFRWLAYAALADWLLNRTLSRAAIFMPKSPPMIAGYQILSSAGLWVSTLTSLLAAGGLLWIAWTAGRKWRAWGLCLAVLAVSALSLAAIIVALRGWLAVSTHLVMLAGIGLLLQCLWLSGARRIEKLAGTLPALALSAGALYQLAPALYEALQLPGPPKVAGLLFNVGELLAVLSPVALWWAFGRPAGWKAWCLAALAPAGLTVFYLFDPAMAGILAIWSVGLTLYLPWPVYALSAWLAGITLFATFRRHHPAGWALLMLAAGGYAPQLSTQAFLGLIALWLVTTTFMPADEWKFAPVGGRAVPTSLA